MPEAGTIIPAKIVSVLPYFILLLYAVTFIRKRFGMFVGGMFLQNPRYPCPSFFP